MCERQDAGASSTVEAHACACSGRGGMVGRQVDAAQEFEMPGFSFPSPGFLASVTEAGLRGVVRRHHELLRFGPLAARFPPEEVAFAELVARVADYVVESCGGAAAYSAAYGATCMRTRHFHFTIDESAREVWLAALFQALAESGWPLAAREAYWNWLEPFSVRMINRRTTKAQPVRISYAAAAARFGPAATVGLPCGLVGRRLCPRA